MTDLRQKSEEFGSFLLGFTYFVLNSIVALTMGSVYALLGIPKHKRTLRHAEIFLVSTTLLLICLIIASRYWMWLGLAVLIVGNLRIFQILSLNLITIVFDFTPISKDAEVIKRARWHFVALGFSFVDILLVFSFMFQWFNDRWQILNVPAGDMGFLDYLYYALVTMATLGYGDILPVTHLGRGIAIYEILVSLFFLVFVVSGAVGRLQKHG